MSYQIRKMQREKMGKTRLYFDLSNRAVTLLKQASTDNGIPHSALIELIIRRYCEPNKEVKQSEF